MEETSTVVQGVAWTCSFFEGGAGMVEGVGLAVKVAAVVALYLKKTKL